MTEQRLVPVRRRTIVSDSSTNDSRIGAIVFDKRRDCLMYLAESARGDPACDGWEPASDFAWSDVQLAIVLVQSARPLLDGDDSRTMSDSQCGDDLQHTGRMKARGNARR